VCVGYHRGGLNVFARSRLLNSLTALVIPGAVRPSPETSFLLRRTSEGLGTGNQALQNHRQSRLITSDAIRPSQIIASMS